MRVARSDRGFRFWPKIKDSRGTILSVHESSADPLGKWLWVNVESGPPSYPVQSAGLHATKSQIKRLIAVLQDAVETMR